MRKELGQWTASDAVDIIDNEGIGYAVQEYVKGNAFKDSELARLWNEAGYALDLLTEYLRSETGRG
jgi:hypothetical protein